MYIEKLALRNYRNYSQLDLNLHPNMNIFMGQNAQGKTNILESIYYLSLGKSHRSNKDSEIIAWDKEDAFIQGKVISKSQEKTIEIGLSKKQKKKIKVNGVLLRKKGDLLGKLNTILFSPEDLKLIKEGPNERRNFMDREISHLKPRYYYALIEYNKVLQQRNYLLKKIRSNSSFEETLPIWDEQLVEIGSKIVQTRMYFLKKINGISKKIHTEITDGLENIELFYQSTLLSNSKDIKNTDNIFYKKLKNSHNIDIQRGTTTIGPHRDDIKININKIDVRSFGSQGQQRTAALSLKLSVFELIYSETGEYPIFLLDDVMSELDEKRQQKLLSTLKHVQSFITCTEPSFLKQINSSQRNIYRVKNGQIEND